MAETFGLAVNIATVLDLFIKLGVQCSVYCAGVKTAPDDVRDILREADKFTNTLKDIQRLLVGSNGAKIEALKNVRRGVEDSRLLLVNLAVKLDQGTKQTGWKRLIWPLMKEEVADIVQKLEQCRVAIALDLHVNQSILFQDVHQEIILAKLRTAKQATFDSHTDACNTRCYAGTRTDILQEILAWGAARDGECIFWLNGMAGTGKSTISRTIAQSFADKGILGASFFFKSGEGDRGRAVFFFPTIVAQLVHQLPSLGPHVRDAIEVDPDIHDKYIKDQFDKLFASPIQKLPKVSCPPIIVIVVDALDECNNLEDARLIIHLLHQARQFTSLCVKFFITSRPELPIVLGFKDIHGKHEGLVLHEIPKPTIEHDIAIFLEHELGNVREDYNKHTTSNLQLPPGWPGPERTKQLVDMAIPLFIFAATICRFLQDRRLGGPRDQLASILENQDNSKSNLDATYLPVLNRLLAGLHESEKRKVADRFKQIVGSIVILATPLSVSSLSQLLGVSHDAIEAHLAHFHSVLSIPLDLDTPVRLLHLSFREFLIDPEKAKEDERYPFWIDERQAHEQLAARCLQLLSAGNKLRRDICDLRQLGTPRAEIKQQTIDASLSPEVQYACQYWVYHWKESNRKIRDEDLVDCFLTRHLLHWLEVLGLLGRISESIGMMGDLLRLLHSKDSKIAAFLHDIQRVILSHRSTIDIWPLQVYSSVILFTPRQSIVRKTFYHQLLAGLSLLPHAGIDWGACLATLEGHSGSVLSVAFSPNSSQFASASDDKTIKLWDAATGACTATLKGHKGRVRSIAFSTDSSRLASGSDDKTIKLWDATTGACTATLKGRAPRGRVESIAFSPNSSQLALAFDSGTINLWDAATGACIAVLKGHSGGVLSIAFSPNSSQLTSASSDKTIKLWDAVINAAMLKSYSGRVRSIAFLACTATLKGHSDRVRSIAFSPDSSRLVSASDDLTIKLWDAATGACLATLKGHSDWVQSIAFSPDSSRLISASDDKTVKLWDATIGTHTALVKGDRRVVQSIAFSPNLSWLVSASDKETLKLWDTTTGACIAILKGYSGVVRSIAFSPDSSRLALASDDKTIQLWDTTIGAYIAPFKGHRGGVQSIAFSPDSSWLASASDDETIKLWDTTTSACIVTFKGHNNWARSIAISPDLSRLALASDDETVKLYNTAIGAYIATLKGHSNWLRSVAMYYDSSWVCRSSDSVWSIAFSPDSSLLASACDDKTLELWDAATGACMATLKGHSSWVRSIAFSPDSSRLASTSYDKTVKLWDTATGACTATLEGYSGKVQSIAFSPDLTLWTDIGTFALNVGVPSGDLRVECRGIGLSEDHAWVVWDSCKILWLPPEYRPLFSVVRGSMLAVGCISGHIILITRLSSTFL